MKLSLRLFPVVFLLILVGARVVHAEPQVSRTQEIENARMPKQAAFSMGVGRPFGFLSYRKAMFVRILEQGTWKVDGPALSCGIATSIDDTGQLKGASVAESSGNKSFDERVLVLFKKSSPFAAPPAELRAYLKNFTLYFDSSGQVIETAPSSRDEEVARQLREKMNGALAQPKEISGPMQIRLTYINQLTTKIKSLWKWKNPGDGKVCKVVVSIGDNGEVSKVRVGESSGDKLFDEAAIATVEKASPFPAPPASLRDDFREIVMTFDSKE